MGNYKFDVYKGDENKKNDSLSKLKSFHIDFNYELPCIFTIDKFSSRDIEAIAKRYITNVISIQFALDVLNDLDIEFSLNFFKDLLNKYDCYEYLNDLEKKTFLQEASDEELISLTAQIEGDNVLAWVLGLSDNIIFPSEECESLYLIETIALCKDFKEFISKCSIRSIDDILGEANLEYQYYCSILGNESSSFKMDDINEEIVVERLKALIWLLDEKEKLNDSLML